MVCAVVPEWSQEVRMT